MNKYTYIDHSNYPDDKIVFKCLAETITQADGMFEKATGKNIIECSYIGCLIEEV